MDSKMYRSARPKKISKATTNAEMGKPTTTPKSNVPLQEVESTTHKATQFMRQSDGKGVFKTFNDWATINDLPFEVDQSVISLPDFKDVLSEYFSKQKKIKDADKIFPRQSRINAIKDDLASGKTPAPNNYPGDDAQWKYHNRNKFQYHPNVLLYLQTGTQPYLVQHPQQLYESLSEAEQEDAKKQWKKHQPDEIYWNQAPVTAIEDSYRHYFSAHIYYIPDQDGKSAQVHHRGRDETYLRLKRGISSSFSKNLIMKINAMCPTCKAHVSANSKTGIEREAKRKAVKDQGGAPTKKRRYENYAQPDNTQIQNHELPQMNFQMYNQYQDHPKVYGTFNKGPTYQTMGGFPSPVLSAEKLALLMGFNEQHQIQPNMNGTINPEFSDKFSNQSDASGTTNYGVIESVQVQPVLDNQYQPQPHLYGTNYTGFSDQPQDQSNSNGTMNDVKFNHPSQISPPFSYAEPSQNGYFGNYNTQNNQAASVDISNIDPEILLPDMDSAAIDAGDESSNMWVPRQGYFGRGWEKR